MSSLHNTIRVIEKINAWAIHLVKWLVPVLILTLVYEVIMRYGMGRPTLWSYDVTYMLCSIFLAIGMAYTLKEGGHVNIDIILEKLSIKQRAILQAVFYVILFFPLWGLITYFFASYVVDSWISLSVARVGTWRPPIYPFNTWIWIGSLLLFLQGIAELLKYIYMAKTGRDDYIDPSEEEKIQEEIAEKEKILEDVTADA